MNIVAIGSIALCPILSNIKPRDRDLIAHPDLESDFDSRFAIKKRIGNLKTIYTGMEVEWARPGTSCELILKRESNGSKHLTGLGDVPLANPHVMRSIMRAHLCFPVQWRKHIERYNKLKVYLIDYEIFQLRQKETADRFGYKPERYRQSNNQFFKDNVKREVPHDDLHDIFKFGERPAFKNIKYDQNSAAIEIDLFNKLSYENQLKTIWEEVLVLGWERILSKSDSDRERVAKRFLYGMATNYLPLEFRSFVVDNYEILLDEFPYYKWNAVE